MTDLTHSVLPAITLWQPWATLVALGIKKYETRGWSYSYLGRLWIHAAKRSLDKQALEILHEYIPGGVEFPLGCIIACVELKAIKLMVTDEQYIATPPFARDGIIRYSAQTAQEAALGLWRAGRFAWEFQNVQQINPIFTRGYQGLWYPGVVE